MFVIAIVILNGIIINNISDIHMDKVKSDALNLRMYEKIEIADSLSQSVKLAYDLGQVTNGCPNSSRQVNGLFLPAPIKLCWTGLSANNCFRSIENKGVTICLSNRQSLTHNINTQNPHFLNLFTSSAYAFSGKQPETPKAPIPNRNPTSENIDPNSYDYSDELNLRALRTYSKGEYKAIQNLEPVSASGLSPNIAGARVILPTRDTGSNVSSNFIDCRTAHTECFSLSFCTNGTPNCNGKSRITQTFAVRHY